MSRTLPTYEDVLRAHARIGEALDRTPLVPSRALSRPGGPAVALKLECFQRTGSFKLRGALAKLSALSPAERRRGILAVSAGNHGLAVAEGASRYGLEATIVVPESASRTKVEAIRRYPVELVEAGAGYDEAEAHALALAEVKGRVFVSPYDDAEIIAGQGTLALELLDADPELDTIVVPAGGGGLLAGVGLVAAARAPSARVIGVEPAASASWTAALAAGAIVPIAESSTLADGLAGNVAPGALSFPLVQRHVHRVVAVDEAAIAAAMALAARQEHLILEGSAAAALAGLSALPADARRVAVVLTGRNVDLAVWAQAAGVAGTPAPGG